MWTTRFVTRLGALAIAVMGVSAAAYAQPGHRHGMPPGPPMHPGHGPAVMHHTPQVHVHVHPGYRPPPPPHAYHRGAGPQHRWVKGSHLPAHYRAPRYVVHDWRKHHLHAPPRGHHWVKHGNDYLLVAVATGVISQLILHHLY